MANSPALDLGDLEGGGMCSHAFLLGLWKRIHSGTKNHGWRREGINSSNRRNSLLPRYIKTYLGLEAKLS